MIDPATLAPLKELAERLAALHDVDAACALLFLKNKTPVEVARDLARTCAPGGEADRLADLLDDPREARRYARRLADTFAPFAEILRALNVTADGQQWVRTGYGYFQMNAEAAKRKSDEIRKLQKKRGPSRRGRPRKLDDAAGRDVRRDAPGAKARPTN